MSHLRKAVVLGLAAGASLVFALAGPATASDTVIRTGTLKPGEQLCSGWVPDNVHLLGESTQPVRWIARGRNVEGTTGSPAGVLSEFGTSIDQIVNSRLPAHIELRICAVNRSDSHRIADVTFTVDPL